MMSEEELLTAVVPNVIQGIKEITKMADILLRFDRTQTVVLQQVINKAVNSLQSSEGTASSHLARVDEQYERLINRRGQLESEKRDLKTTLENLNTLEQSILYNLEKKREARERAQTNLESTQKYLQDCRDREQQNQAVRDAGIGMMFIPIIGLIPGAIMVGVGQAEMDKAVEQAKNAEEEVENYQSLVQSLERQLSEKKLERQEQKRLIELCITNIQQNAASLDQSKSQQVQMSCFQMKLRDAVHFLGVLAGRVKVAQDVAHHPIILLEPLLNTTQEILGWLFAAAGEGKRMLMERPNVQEALQGLKYLDQQIRAISEAPSDLKLLEDQYG